MPPFLPPLPRRGRKGIALPEESRAGFFCPLYTGALDPFRGPTTLKGPTEREHLVRALARLKIKVYQPSPYLRVYGLIKPRLSFYSKTSFTVLWALPIESI